MRLKAMTTLAAAAAMLAGPLAELAQAQSGGDFPFGLEMTLDAAPKPGSKRIPSVEIGDNGEARLELWCKSGSGQFSVAGNTVIFMPGALEDHNCPSDRAQADDALLTALAAATNWTRQGDTVSFTGTQPLRFRINSN